MGSLSAEMRRKGKAQVRGFFEPKDFPHPHTPVEEDYEAEEDL
jgi:hypothetical protein